MGGTEQIKDALLLKTKNIAHEVLVVGFFSHYLSRNHISSTT